MTKKSNIRERIGRGLQDLYAFYDGMAFPVLLFVYNGRQRAAVLYLLKNTSAMPYKTEDICRWACAHGVEYEVFMSWRDRMLPWRRLMYRRIMQQNGGDKS